MPVRIQTADFDLSTEVAVLRAGRRDVGAVASFVGVVRDLNDGASVGAMTLEHYPGMTERSIQAIIDEARTRWSVYDAMVIHRVGELQPGDQIVLVVVTGAHRGEAFAACEFIMDYLKTRAPFWKKEQLGKDSGQGGGQESRWVEARASDDAAAAKWSGGAGKP